MAGTKFCGSTSRLLLLSVPAFIMLSGAAVTEKSRSCYWCGPLAEQVHRSQRAPPCEAADDHVTACDHDTPYCAVIATSPPYVESRLCVKLYQDECYPLFCNSTKTWKMTCPCRGELCNGPNTEREDEAFAILAKLVAKTRNTRIKKRTHLKAANFISTEVEKTLIVTNISAFENSDLRTLSRNLTDGDQITRLMLSDDPAAGPPNPGSEEVPSTLETIKEDDKTSTPSLVVFGNIEDLYSVKPHDTKGTTTGLETMKTEKPAHDTVKPSEQLPTAEALQQNTTPKSVSEKTTLPNTSGYETTDQTTINDDTETTTMEQDGNNNGGSKLYSVTYTVFLSMVPVHIYNYKYALSYLH